VYALRILLSGLWQEFIRWRVQVAR
jgi:hypothetical protein